MKYYEVLGILLYKLADVDARAFIQRDPLGLVDASHVGYLI